MFRYLLLSIVITGVSNARKEAEPQVLVHSMTIELTEDLYLSNTSLPFVAHKEFGATEPATLTFTSKKGCAVVVPRDKVWDLTSFTHPHSRITFTGSAQLRLETGATLKGDHTKFFFYDRAKCIVGRAR